MTALVFTGLLLTLLYGVATEFRPASSGQTSPQAQQGVIDFSAIEFSSSQALPLEGQWGFYWQKLLSPASLATRAADSNEVLQVPITWELQTYRGESLPAYGYGTYHLKLKLPVSEQILALSVPIMSSAYRLYINQELRLEVGQVGVDESSSIPGRLSQIATFQAIDGQAEIVLQVSNFDLLWAGQWLPIQVSSIDKLLQSQLTRDIKSIGIIGIFFTFSIINLMYFFLRNRDKLPLVIALSCFCLGLRELDTSQILYSMQGQSISFSTAMKINFLTFYLICPLIALYAHISYPREYSRSVLLAFIGIAAVFCGLTLFTEPRFFGDLLSWYQGLAVITTIYALYAVFLAAYRKRMGARIIAVGSLVLSICAFNDILYSLDISKIDNMASFGLVVFILCQNYMTYLHLISDSKDMAILSLQVNQDPLTSLLNRRGLQEALNQFDMDRRLINKSYSILLIDFDHFKQLNDTLGHDGGDKVLVYGSKVMLSHIRSNDLAARWGGEEFVVFLPNTELKGAGTVAEKLRVKLSKSLGKRIGHPVTVSIGVAQCQGDEDFDDCLKRADTAMYAAKAQGRNCVKKAD